MNTEEKLMGAEGIKKLKKLVDEINICLFCTDLKTDDGATCRPMTAIEVDEAGNLWFFSGLSSEKNAAIKRDNQVQLFFAHPPKGSYMIVNGHADITTDKAKIQDLWSPMHDIWFQGGKNDPDLSVIKVTPKNAYFWDSEGNRMVNILKMVTSVITGKNLIDGTEGSITL